MRIGIVCYPTFGGSGVIATELGIALSKKGYEVHFITYNVPVRLDLISKGIYFHQVEIEEYPLFLYQPYEIALSTKMVQVVEQYKLNLLHVHYAIPHAYAAYMAKKMLLEKGISLKVVTTLHGTDITLLGNHPNYKMAVEFSINQSDVVTAVSNSLSECTYRLFDIKKEIKVIYNFVELEKYSQKKLEFAINRDRLASQEEFILIHIGNYRLIKRPVDIVKVFHKVSLIKPVKLVLIGEGPEMDRVRKKAKELKVYDKILFLGKINEVEKVLYHADIFLLLSELESFGFAALEAMAAKTAIISTNVGGLVELNRDGLTGFLNEVGDIEKMSENVLKILESREKLDFYKKNAFERAKLFTSSEIVPKYEEIYKNLVEI